MRTHDCILVDLQEGGRSEHTHAHMCTHTHTHVHTLATCPFSCDACPASEICQQEDHHQIWALEPKNVTYTISFLCVCLCALSVTAIALGA